MKVAFIHYHLDPGGVTTVIRRQVAAVRQNGGQALLLAGTRPREDLPAPFHPVAGLGYGASAANDTADAVAAHIAKAVLDRWPGGCDLVHVHNPLLAKNEIFPAVLDTLQRRGLRLLLQVHDFAEDGRPQAFFRSPYPGNCHYCVINGRDYRVLRSAGLRPEGLHLLPNAVPDPGPARPRPRPQTPYVLYPVRAIRRKNIGEALLLALFSGHAKPLVITLPPTSAPDRPSYRNWRQFARAHNLSVRFEAGRHTPFPDLVAGADRFVTTSITEGFGFAFLSPWVAGKSLAGRKLPSVCRDFEQKGLSLDMLYTRLEVPFAWLDRDRFLRTWCRAVRNAAAHFQYDPPGRHRVQQRLETADTVDFGLLDEKAQQEVLSRLARVPAEKKEVAAQNPLMEEALCGPVPQPQVLHNREVVMAHYGTEPYARRLAAMYRRVMATDVSQEIRKDALLAHFFNLEHFSLLKWAPYEEQDTSGQPIPHADH